VHVCHHNLRKLTVCDPVTVDIPRYHELGAASLPTPSRVTKFANPIRAVHIVDFLYAHIARWGEAEADYETQRVRWWVCGAHRVFISLAHVIALRGVLSGRRR